METVAILGCDPTWPAQPTPEQRADVDRILREEWGLYPEHTIWWCRGCPQGDYWTLAMRTHTAWKRLGVVYPRNEHWDQIRQHYPSPQPLNHSDYEFYDECDSWSAANQRLQQECFHWLCLVHSEKGRARGEFPPPPLTTHSVIEYEWDTRQWRVLGSYRNALVGSCEKCFPQSE